MARYDKYDPLISGTRGHLANDWLESDLDKVVGVGLNAKGAFVKGAAISGIVGVLVLTRIIRAGQQVIDVMKRGDVVEFHKEGRPSVVKAGVAAGTKFYADAATGEVTTTNTGVYVGHTVEKDRLVVSMAV